VRGVSGREREIFVANVCVCVRVVASELEL